MTNELTPEQISHIINTPDNPIGREIAQRAARVESGEERTYSSEKLLDMLNKIQWDERWEAMSPEERRRELAMMDDHVAETERHKLD